MNARTLTRNDVTWAAYALSLMFTLLLGFIGPLLPHLRAELGISYGVAALHTSAFAVGMVLAGFVGERVIREIGRRATVWTGVVGLAVGLTLMGSAQDAWLSIAGCLVMGLLGSLMAVVWPAVLAEIHGRSRGLAFVEQSIIAYVGALAAPVIIWALVASGSWRTVAMVGWLSVVVCVIAYRNVVFAPPPQGVAGRGGRLPASYWAYWSALSAIVAAEFAVLVWASTFLESERGLSREAAVLAAAIFPTGMILGRCTGVLLLRHFVEAQVVLPSIGLAGFGFCLFWGIPFPIAAFIGLFLTGVGIANLYPAVLTLAMDAAGSATSAAAARTPLSAGIAIIGAPLVMGTLADIVGMRAAYVVLPGFLALAVACFLMGRRTVPARKMGSSSEIVSPEVVR